MPYITRYRSQHQPWYMGTSCRPYFRLIDLELVKCGPHSVLASHAKGNGKQQQQQQQQSISWAGFCRCFLYKTFSLFYLLKWNGTGSILQMVNVTVVVVRVGLEDWRMPMPRLDGVWLPDMLSILLSSHTVWILWQIIRSVPNRINCVFGGLRKYFMGTSSSQLLLLFAYRNRRPNSSVKKQKERVMHSCIFIVYCHPLLHL